MYWAYTRHFQVQHSTFSWFANYFFTRFQICWIWKFNIFTFDHWPFEQLINAIYCYLSHLQHVLSVYKTFSSPTQYFFMICKLFFYKISDLLDLENQYFYFWSLTIWTTYRCYILLFKPPATCIEHIQDIFKSNTVLFHDLQTIFLQGFGFVGFGKSIIFTFGCWPFRQLINAIYCYLRPLQHVLSVYKIFSSPTQYFFMICKLFFYKVSDLLDLYNQ